MPTQSIGIVEVGARDGLQNEATAVDTRTKLELIGRIIESGVRRIEVASFVNPGAVPQMADAEDVCAGLRSDAGVSYIGLVLNRRGLERALGTAVDEVNFVIGATERFTMENQGKGIVEAAAEIEAMVPDARSAGRRVTVTISVAFGCPYEGEVPAAVVGRLATRMVAAGADEIALGDTVGAAVPTSVAATVDAVSAELGGVPLRCHFHDTRNTAIANVYAALLGGVRVFDGSVGGVGGCPYAPGASGNVATEDLAYTLERMGWSTGVSAGSAAAAGAWLKGRLGRLDESAYARAGGFPAGRT